MYSNLLIAQLPHTIPVYTQPNSVLVYLEGARIQREAMVTLKPGKNQIEFRGLSSQLDRQSLQFSSNQPLNIMSLSIQTDFEQKLERGEALVQLKKELSDLENSILKNQSEQHVWNQKENVLNSNVSFGGEDKITVEELSNMNSYFEKEHQRIQESLFDLRHDLDRLTLKKDTLIRKLDELNHDSNLGLMVRIQIESEISKQIQCTLSYIVNQCGWYPEYDVRASAGKKEITLDYKALVYNNTGNDWNDMELTLSTGMPQVSAELPDLLPWYIDQNSFAYFKSRNTLEGKVQSINVPKGYEGDLIDLQNQLEQQVDVREVMISDRSTTFEIPDKYTIPSNFLPYYIPIDTYTLPAIYHFAAVPKLDRHAFLMASITNWESLNLVQGPASIYYEESYRGKVEIDTYQTDDTLVFSMGRDDKLVSQVEKLKEFTRKQLIGGNRKDSYSYEITVKNTHRLPVQMNVIDQVPVSNDQEIEIEADELSNGELNRYTGEVTWDLDLAPGEIKKIVLSYTLKYPKNKVLNTGNYRKVKSVRFM
jgi:uncharacterized protein (TIGR02231 family)